MGSDECSFPAFVPHTPGKSANEFDEDKLTNGAQNLILRIKCKSCVPAGVCSCAADAVDLDTDAALLEAAIHKPLWRRVVQGAGAKAQLARRTRVCKIPLKVSTVAVAVTAQYSLGGVGFRFPETLQPGYLAYSWQQQVHWCNACTHHRISIDPHLREGADKHSMWGFLVDDLEREPGTVFIDELYINLQMPEGEEECARDVRKPVTWVPAEAAAAALPVHVHDAAQSHVLPPSAAWLERKFE